MYIKFKDTNIRDTHTQIEIINDGTQWRSFALNLMSQSLNFMP